MGGIGHGKHCIGAQDGYVPFPYQSGDKKTGRGCRLMKELEAGENSGELIDEAEAYRLLGVTEL